MSKSENLYCIICYSERKHKTPAVVVFDDDAYCMAHARQLYSQEEIDEGVKALIDSGGKTRNGTINLGLTEKERGFVAGIADGKKPSEAMRDAGYSEHAARGQKALQNPRVRIVLALLIREKITPNIIIDRLSDGLSATKDNGKPDFAERREYLKLAVKYGMYHDDSQKFDIEVLPDEPDKSIVMDKNQ